MARSKITDDTDPTDPIDPTDLPVATPTEGPSIIGGLPPEDYLSEQEKLGPDPVEPAVDPVPAEILDIPTKQPYPTADTPPPPEAA